MNESLLLLQAKLDEVTSKKNLNADIKKIQSQLDKLKVQVEPDPKSLSDLSKQLESVLNQTVGKAGGKGNAQGITEELVHDAEAMAASISKIDASLAELKKASDRTADQLENVADQAFASGKRLAGTGADVLEAAADFKRAGDTISDSMAYAEEALKMTHIREQVENLGQSARQSSKTVPDSGLIKWFVDLGSAAITAADKLAHTFETMGTLGMGITTFVKGFD